MSLSKGCRFHAARTEHPQPMRSALDAGAAMRRRASTEVTAAGPLRGKWTERDSLHGLNDRLAGFIEKVHRLERHNQLLEQEIVEIRGKAKPASALEQEFGAEIGRLRQLVRDISRQKHEIEMEHLNLEEEVSRLREQSEKEAQSRSDAERSVTALKKDISAAYEEKLQLDRKAQCLVDEMLFLRSNHEAEVAEMLEQIHGAQQLTVEAHEFGSAGVTAALRDIRAQLEGHAAADVQQVGDAFHSQFARLTEEAESKRQALKVSQQEIQEYRRRLQAKSVELDCAKGTRDALERQLHDVEDRHKEEMIHYQNTIQELENELINYKFDMSGYLREYQDLLNVKMALDVEILSYRKLLCGEEARLSSMSDSSVSLPYIYHQSPVYTLPCLSRPGGPHRRAEPQYKFVEEIITETTREIEMSEFEETGSEETEVGRDERGCKRDAGGSEEEDGDQVHGEDDSEQVSDGQQGEGSVEVSGGEGGDEGGLDEVGDGDAESKEESDETDAADDEDKDTHSEPIQSPDLGGNDQKVAENAIEEKEDSLRSPEPEELCTEPNGESKETDAANNEDKDTLSKPIQSPDLEGSAQKTVENAVEEKEDVAVSTKTKEELLTKSKDGEKEDVALSQKPKEEILTKSKEESKEAEAAVNGEKDTQSKPIESPDVEKDNRKVMDNATEEKKDVALPPKPELKEESKETKAADNGNKDTQSKPTLSTDVEKDDQEVAKNATEMKKDTGLPPKPEKEHKEESKGKEAAVNGDKDIQSKPIESPDVEKDNKKVMDNATEEKKDVALPPKPKELLCTELKEESKETKTADNGNKDTQSKPTPSTDVEKDDQEVAKNATEMKKDTALPPKPEKEHKEESKGKEAAVNGDKDTQSKPAGSPDLGKSNQKTAVNGTEVKEEDAILSPKQKEVLPTKPKEESKEKAADNGDQVTQKKQIPSPQKVAGNANGEKEDVALLPKSKDELPAKPKDDEKKDANLPPKPKEEVPAKPTEESKEREAADVDKEVQSKPIQSPPLEKNDQKVPENATEAREDAAPSPKQKEERLTKPQEELKEKDAADDGDKDNQSKPMATEVKESAAVPPKPKEGLPPQPKDAGKEDAGSVALQETSARSEQPAEAEEPNVAEKPSNIKDKVQTSATAEKPADMIVEPKDIDTEKSRTPAEPLTDTDKPSKSIEEKAEDSSKGGNKEPSPKSDVNKVPEVKDDESKNQPGEILPSVVEVVVSAGVPDVHKGATESGPAPSPLLTEKTTDTQNKAEEESGSKPEK